MRVPPLLDGYALSICSGDFNQWTRKNVTVDSPMSYMFHAEYEMPEFGIGRTFDYAELAALIAPRRDSRGPLKSFNGMALPFLDAPNGPTDPGVGTASSQVTPCAVVPAGQILRLDSVKPAPDGTQRTRSD